MSFKERLILAVAAAGLFTLYGHWLAQRDHSLFQRYGIEHIRQAYD